MNVHFITPTLYREYISALVPIKEPPYSQYQHIALKIMFHSFFENVKSNKVNTESDM